MEIKCFELKDKNNLINKLFKISYAEEDLPYKSIYMPSGFTTLSYSSAKTNVEMPKGIQKNDIGLRLTGQHFRSYDFTINSEGIIFGVEFHPTAFYKIFKTDLSTLSNKHIDLDLIDKHKSEQFMQVFQHANGNETVFINDMVAFLENIDIYQDEDIFQIDKAIHLIFKKKGILHLSDVLNLVPFSQKTLETKFKKIIGLTPGKYIRLIRFRSLMKAYEKCKIDLKTLMYDYNYYDESHLKKDFKQFLNKTPNAYLKEDYPIIKKYLQN
ncbi:helix-turn-helix domain-containing protein [Polaribacter sp.]|uniref:helix-turn-helix domain-containing protein n=1 Tax=Polaribacter sp. TaxID=1920175 RepID=UPI003F6C0791